MHLDYTVLQAYFVNNVTKVRYRNGFVSLYAPESWRPPVDGNGGRKGQGA